MNRSPALLVNAVLGSMIVTIGLWLLLGHLELPVTVVLVVGFTLILTKVSPTIWHVWAWSTMLLGIESLAWPFLTMSQIPDLGPEPPLEDMQRVFTSVLFGLFSGVFWLTFSYGIYRRIHPKAPQSESPSSRVPSPSKKKKKKNR